MFNHLRRNQKGFTLLETTMVMLVVFVGIVSGFWIATNKMKDARAVILADQMMVLDGALGTYRTKNYAALTSAVPVIAGFVDPMQPTPAELKTAGFLNAGFSDTTIYGSNYVPVLAKTPSGCVAPDCDIKSLVLISAPILLTGTATPDLRTLGVIAGRIGGNAGVSYTAGTLEGADGGWTETNPLNLAGLVAIQGGYNTQGFTEFYRRDGALPLTASLAMGGNTISGLQSKVVGAACTSAGEVAQDASGALLSCQGGTWQPQGSGYWKDPVGTFAALPACNAAAAWQTRVVQTPTVGAGPRAYTCNGASWIALAVDNSGNLNVPAIVTAGTSVNAPVFYDSNNTSYYVDPASTSVLNNVQSGNTAIGGASSTTATGTIATGAVEVKLRVTEGTACSPNGKVAVDSTGLLLSCQSGVWAKASGTSSAVDPTTGYTSGFCSFTPSGQGGASYTFAVKKVGGTYYGAVNGSGWAPLTWNGFAQWQLNTNGGFVKVFQATPTTFTGSYTACPTCGSCSGVVS